MGKRHEVGIYNESNIRNTIDPHLVFNGWQHILYGDPAYPISYFILAPYRGAVLSE